MAAVYGRLTGKAGVCISTFRPGATNFTTICGLCSTGWYADVDDYGAETGQKF